MPTSDYIPPDSSSIQARQNDPRALGLLIAQRRLYSRGKRWQGTRWIGLLILGIGAPFVSLLVPDAAVIIGALAGAWLFAGRTALAWLEARAMVRAACIQEILDLYVFAMPTTIVRAEAPSPEDIAALIGKEEDISKTARAQKLTDWYTIDETAPGTMSIAVAQRSNAAYTDRLIRTAVATWTILGAVWVTFLIVWAAVSGIAFSAFLLGVCFPVLPAFLDATEYVLSTWKAHQDRADLATTVKARLSPTDHPVAGEDLLVWQERLFDLRRSTPQVPDWLYKLTRKRNEAAMNVAARQLHESVRPAQVTSEDEGPRDRPPQTDDTNRAESHGG